MKYYANKYALSICQQQKRESCFLLNFIPPKEREAIAMLLLHLDRNVTRIIFSVDMT